MTMPNPHLIDEDQSDIRGIKDGWYAMDHIGHLVSGPFASRDDCLAWINLAAVKPMPFDLWRPQP
jgi:hypothetical protein